MNFIFFNENVLEVPACRVKEFFQKKHKYCVCVFVINEGERIRKQLAKMQAFADRVDIIIADGGSTDGSLDAEFLEKSGVRALLVKTGEGKLGAQMRMAFHYALKAGYSGVIVMDGNNKDDPSAIPLFVGALDEGYDHVQGSRFIAGGRHENTPIVRLLAVRFLHAPLISFAAGFRYTDTTNGFRAYSKKFLSDERVSPFREVFSGYEMHYYLAIRGAELGFKIKEVPVVRVYPAGVKTPTKISSVRGNLLVLKTLFKACFKVYNPKK